MEKFVESIDNCTCSWEQDNALSADNLSAYNEIVKSTHQPNFFIF